MTQHDLPRILVVDDEEAILETMTFTFMDVYEVLTAGDGERALQVLDDKAPIAAIITDQRMPHMTGVELLSQARERHPETVRIMLTGFADAEATIQAINDGHIYGYVNKPWESAELKQVVKRAVEHHELAMENARLLADLSRSNHLLTAVMDRFDVGAIAIDSEGCVQAWNQPARAYLGLEMELRGEALCEALESQGLSELARAAEGLTSEDCGGFEELDLRIDGSGRRLRVSAQTLMDPEGASIGQVVLFKEISHEPLRRRFEEILTAVAQKQGELRPEIEAALGQLAEVTAELGASDIASPRVSELSERVSRSQTALQSWLDVDDAMAREDYPDAQLLVDRMRIATQRWPYPDELPGRVLELVGSVEAYYESGENRKQRVL